MKKLIHAANNKYVSEAQNSVLNEYAEYISNLFRNAKKCFAVQHRIVNHQRRQSGRCTPLLGNDACSSCNWFFLLDNNNWFCHVVIVQQILQQIINIRCFHCTISTIISYYQGMGWEVSVSRRYRGAFLVFGS